MATCVTVQPSPFCPHSSTPEPFYFQQAAFIILTTAVLSCCFMLRRIKCAIPFSNHIDAIHLYVKKNDILAKLQAESEFHLQQ